MAKQNENCKVQVVLFVEGDTDEVLFKALIDYYRSISMTELNPCKICNRFYSNHISHRHA